MSTINLKIRRMRNPLQIGDKIYKYKKDALIYYKTILNSYEFGQSLNDNDFNDLIDLLCYDPSSYNEEIIDELNDQEQDRENEDAINQPNEVEYNETSDQELYIEDIKIARVQFNAKCFELIFSDSTSEYTSYTMLINRPEFCPDRIFNTACRNSIIKDLRLLKQQYFDDNSVKGHVKCQETNQMSKWEDLAVDHRQPNTFSVIVDRFKEVNKIDVSKVDYFVDNNNLLLFENENLTADFRKYHKEKANLRIVRKECNLSRTGMAKIKRSNKDLTIK